MTIRKISKIWSLSLKNIGNKKRCVSLFFERFFLFTREVCKHFNEYDLISSILNFMFSAGNLTDVHLKFLLIICNLILILFQEILNEIVSFLIFQTLVVDKQHFPLHQLGSQMILKYMMETEKIQYFVEGNKINSLLNERFYDIDQFLGVIYSINIHQF